MSEHQLAETLAAYRAEIGRLHAELARRDEQLAIAWEEGSNAANLWTPGTPIPRNPYRNPTPGTNQEERPNP
jgi:hypothetical protein